MSTGAELAIVYVAIAFISMFVYKKRAGMGVMTTPGLSPAIIGWFLLSFVKALLWPLVLIVWIFTGRPEPRLKLERTG
jgi:hypothetical protein